MGAALSGFKSLGDRGWIGFFSNVFYDRDIKPDAPRGERFTLDAWKEAVEWMNDGNLPDLEFWHMSNAKIGKASKVHMIGPFVVAEGVWLEDEKGQKAQAYFEKSDADWRMSHGFTYRLADRKSGEYHKVRPHELTVLPGHWAANLKTVFMEGNMGSLKADVSRAFAELFGVSEDEAKEAVDEALEMAGKSLPEGVGKGQKDAAEAGETAAADEAPAQDEGEAGPAVAEAEAEPSGDEGDEGGDDVGDDVLATALIDTLSELREERSLREALVKRVDELEKGMKALRSDEEGVKALDGIEQRVKALEDADAQRVDMLPKAVRKALASRAADKGADEVSPEEAAEDVEARESALQGKQSRFSNGVDWMIEQMNAGRPSAG